MNKARRKDLSRALDLLSDARFIIEQARDEEQDAYNCIPENLLGSERAERMDEIAYSLDNIVSELEDRESELDDIING